MAVRITCINKASGAHENPYIAITNLGWVNPNTGENGRSTREQMYDWINGGGQAYVHSGAATAQVITAVSPRGTKYVKTRADNTDRDNLLKLPECG